MLKTAANPEGLPIEVFDSLGAGLISDRAQFYKDLAIKFYGANRPGARVSQGLLDQFWLWSMQAGLKNAYESITATHQDQVNAELLAFLQSWPPSPLAAPASPPHDGRGGRQREEQCLIKHYGSMTG